MSMFDFRSKSNPTTPLSPAAGNNCSASFLVSSEECSPEQMALASVAARTIQRHFRGFLGRRRYAARLWEVYAEEEEKQRREMENILIEETEILVEARKAKIDMEEMETVKKT